MSKRPDDDSECSVYDYYSVILLYSFDLYFMSRIADSMVS